MVQVRSKRIREKFSKRTMHTLLKFSVPNGKSDTDFPHDPHSVGEWDKRGSNNKSNE